MKLLLTIQWPDAPEGEEEFDTLEDAHKRTDSIAAMPWVVAPPSWELYDCDGRLMEEGP